MATKTVRIGISGWRYAPWRGVFYPEGLPQRDELTYVSRHLPTVELNGSFYSLQRPQSYQAWHDATPAGFVFAIKGSRYITHQQRLDGVEGPLANFLASGILALGAKLGPMLWQLPPSMPFDAGRLEAFFALLPRDTDEALRLARRHDARVEGRAWLEVRHPQRLRHAVEVRHASFVDAAFIALLRRHRIALVVAETAGRWPLLEDLTADFVYVRLHGDRELYASGYDAAALDRWAARIDAWRHGRQPADARLASDRAPSRRAGRDVYCYFDNDVKAHAPFDAARLIARLGLPGGIADAEAFVPPPGMPEPRRQAPRNAASRRASASG